MKNEAIESRRELIRSVLRFGAAGALGVGAAFLAIRRSDAKAESTCVNRGICSGCGSYDNCYLPRSLARKEALKDNS